MAVWEPLPEVLAPAEAAACTRCALCGHGGRVIWAEGNQDAPLFILLDNPGAREDATGAPWVCPTRAALRQALREAGVPEEGIYVTWLLKCRPRRAYDREAAQRACRPYLSRQLAEVAPGAVAVLGNTALRAWLDDPRAEVRALRGQLLGGGPYPAICSYHPLAVHRRPVLAPFLAADLTLAWRLATAGEGGSLH